MNAAALMTADQAHAASAPGIRDHLVAGAQVYAVSDPEVLEPW